MNACLKLLYYVFMLPMYLLVLCNLVIWVVGKKNSWLFLKYFSK